MDKFFAQAVSGKKSEGASSHAEEQKELLPKGVVLGKEDGKPYEMPSPFLGLTI